MVSYCSMVAVSIWDNKKVLETDSGDHCEDTVSKITASELYT